MFGRSITNRRVMNLMMGMRGLMIYWLWNMVNHLWFMINWLWVMNHQWFRC